MLIQYSVIPGGFFVLFFSFAVFHIEFGVKLATLNVWYNMYARILIKHSACCMLSDIKNTGSFA